MSTQEQTNAAYTKFLRQTLRLQREASREFHYALCRAKEAAADVQIDLALQWCKYGASVAIMSNPGFFYSHEMEQLLGQIGQRYGTPVTASSDATAAPTRFLHVTTVTSATGGHTRAISSWIQTCAQHAPSEHHSILISNQEDEPVPAWIIDSVQRSGGEVIQLPISASWLHAAAQIREISLGFDAVILHTEPHDLRPNLAFYDQPKPVMFFRHTDHVFTLGIDVARVVADIRPVGHDLSARFFPPTPRKVLLPLPLFDDGHASWNKADARKKLGLSADALIALTIGEPHKFMPMPGYSFPALVQSLCAANPRVLIVAVGISGAETFLGLGRSMGEQFMPVGVVKDRDILELYYDAADIYLDAFPCSSLTAVMDAARHGLPVQRLYNPYQRLMWCDDPELDSVIRGVPTQDEFVAGALEWLQWPEEKRLELGNRFRAAVLQEHSGASWKNRWLDPAVNALNLPAESPLSSVLERTQEKEFWFFGLGKWCWGAWPAGMFAAQIILGTDNMPPRIRISGILHSIKPLLFDMAEDGMAWKRLLIFLRLVASIGPKDIVAALRKMFRAIFKKL